MNPVEKYFNSEKYESVFFVFVGIVAITLAGYFLLRMKQPFYNGMACSLVAIALIQITVGTSVYFRSPRDIIRVNQIAQTDKAKIQSEEIPRMQVVMRNFVLYRWIEIALIITGVILFLVSQDKLILKGVGLGLAIQAGFMLVLDFFAESRGKVYLEYLQQLLK